MPRIRIAISLCTIIVLFFGCGGGGSGGKSAHSSGTVTVQVDMSRIASRLATAAKVGQNSANERLVPSNTSILHVTYKQVDSKTDDLVNGATDEPVTPNLTTPTTATVTLSQFAAGVPNTITVFAEDGNFVTLASGTTTVQIAAGSTNTQAPVTLASTVTGTVTFVVQSTQKPLPASLNASASLTVQANFYNTTKQQVTTILPQELSWTATPAGYAQLTNNGDGTATIQELQPGNVLVTVTYTEPAYSQVIQTGSFGLALNAPVLNLQQTLRYKKADQATNVPAGALFDLSSDGNSLYYDSLMQDLKVVPQDSTLGYSRIAPPHLVFPPLSDVADFDTMAAGPASTSGAYCGVAANTASRMVALSSLNPPAWAVVKKDGSLVASLPNDTHLRYPTAPAPSWTYAPAGASIIDLDARGANLYLLEQVGASYQIETITQSTASKVGSALPVQLSYAPTSLAVLLVTDSSGSLVETDYYLAGAARIAQYRVPVSGSSTLMADFTDAGGSGTVVSPLDIAASGDTRFLYELDSSGKIFMFSTANGALPVASRTLKGEIIAPVAGTVGGSRLSASISGGAVSLYVLDQDSTSPTQETFVMK